MKNLFITLIIAIIPFWALSQEEVGFIADRPGATTGVEVMPQWRLQWETGIGYQYSELDNPITETHTLNTSLLRLGILKFAELRFQADYLYTIAGKETTYDFSDVAIGTKISLFDGAKAIPAVSLLGNVYFTDGGQIGLLFQNELTSWLSLGYEADIMWKDDPHPILFWGACLGFQVTERFSMMAEEYNYNMFDDYENWMELGAMYQLTHRLQVDISTDIHLNYPTRYYNIMLGVAWQITKK